ncbi:MAG: hypothetical protein KBT11_09675 [Treponema sp.]|nr:hypothetical protein [Candidatus Treponema equifaecale]
MKLNKIILGLTLVAGLSLAGCASTKVSLSEFSPVAVIGVDGNPSLYLVDDNYETDEDADSALTASVNKYLEGKNPEYLTAQDRLDYAEDYLRRALAEIGGFEVLDKDFVTKSDDYIYAKGASLLGFMDPTISATGYQSNMQTMGAKKARMLMGALGAKALVSAQFEFDKKKNLNDVTAVVKMKVHFIDAQGKEVVNKEYMAESSESVRNMGGKYNKDALVDLYPAVIENIINKFVVEYVE